MGTITGLSPLVIYRVREVTMLQKELLPVFLVTYLLPIPYFGSSREIIEGYLPLVIKVIPL